MLFFLGYLNLRGKKRDYFWKLVVSFGLVRFCAVKMNQLTFYNAL